MKKVAYLDAQLRAVAKDTKDAGLQKKLVVAYNELEQANQELADATDAYTANDDDEQSQKTLSAACGNVKTKAAAAVELAKQALESQKIKERPTEVQNVGNADIDAETTPLHFATLKGDMSAVRDLINKGMKVRSN
jgi:6-pyruvoyl-tetrahydropterin synthase